MTKSLALKASPPGETNLAMACTLDGNGDEPYQWTTSDDELLLRKAGPSKKNILNVQQMYFPDRSKSAVRHRFLHLTARHDVPSSARSTPCPEEQSRDMASDTARAGLKLYTGVNTLWRPLRTSRPRLSLSPTAVSKQKTKRMSIVPHIPRRWSPRRHAGFTSLRHWALPEKSRTRQSPRPPVPPQRFVKPVATIEDPIVVSSSSSEDDEMEETRSVEEAMAALTSEFDIPSSMTSPDLQSYLGASNEPTEEMANATIKNVSPNYNLPFYAEEDHSPVIDCVAELEEALNSCEPEGKTESAFQRLLNIIQDIDGVPTALDEHLTVLEQSTPRPDVASNDDFSDCLAANRTEDENAGPHTPCLVATDVEHAIRHLQLESSGMPSAPSAAVLEPVVSCPPSPPPWFTNHCRRLARRHLITKLRHKCALRAAYERRDRCFQSFLSSSQWTGLSDSEDYSSDSSEDECGTEMTIAETRRLSFQETTRGAKRAQWLRRANLTLRDYAEQRRLHACVEIDWFRFREGDLKRG